MAKKIKKQKNAANNSQVETKQAEQQVEPAISHPPAGSWPELKLPEFSVLMVIGSKNTGKSTLCSYFLTQFESVCLLDCDIGRNMRLPGCVSFVCDGRGGEIYSQSIFIGETTPLSRVDQYIAAVRTLFTLYRQKYFTLKLVINTMGYLTGLGELLLFAIHSQCEPDMVLELTSTDQDTNSNNLLETFRTANYGQRNLFSGKPHCRSSVLRYSNQFGLAKGSQPRFQQLISRLSKCRNLYDFIQLIESRNMGAISIGKLWKETGDTGTPWQQCPHDNADHCIVYLGSGDSSCYRPNAVGYGLFGKVWADTDCESYECGLVCSRLEMDRQFYHLTEQEAIDLEVEYGRLNHLSVWVKALGNRNVRNNPAKKG